MENLKDHYVLYHRTTQKRSISPSRGDHTAIKHEAAVSKKKCSREKTELTTCAVMPLEGILPENLGTFVSDCVKKLSYCIP